MTKEEKILAAAKNHFGVITIVHAASVSDTRYAPRSWSRHKERMASMVKRGLLKTKDSVFYYLP